MGDPTAGDPRSIEIWPEHAAAAFRAFLRWAEPSGQIRVLFSPDTMMAIDGDSARGYLVDDVYLVRIWIAKGQDAFFRCLEAEASQLGVDVTEMSHNCDEPTPSRTLAAIVEYGQDLAEVRDLL